MRKITMIFVLLPTLAVSFLSCNNKTALTNDQKADTLVRHFLDSTLNDPKSYEAIKFEKLDTVMTVYTDDPAYKKLPIAGIDQRLDDVVARYEIYEKRMDNGYYEKLDKLNQAAQDSLEKVYKPKIKGYHVKHSFRAKNGFNALTLHSMGFNIDTGFTRVLDSYDAKD